MIPPTVIIGNNEFERQRKRYPHGVGPCGSSQRSPLKIPLTIVCLIFNPILLDSLSMFLRELKNFIINPYTLSLSSLTLVRYKGQTVPTVSKTI